MDKKQQNGKRPQLNLMMMTSLVMIIPASTLISNALNRNTHGAPFSASNSAGSPTADSSLIERGSTRASSEITETDSKPRQQIQRTADGNLVKENYDEKGRRVFKVIFTPAGALLNRWDFEPVSGRIIRYEINEYREKRLAQRRVARWEYAADGGFSKMNQFFDSTGKPEKSFNESANAKGVKYKEEWFDEKKRLIAEKRWDPQTGDFASYFMTEYGLAGWATRTYVSETGKVLRESLVTPSGKSFNTGIIRIGKEKQ